MDAEFSTQSMELESFTNSNKPLALEQISEEQLLSRNFHLSVWHNLKNKTLTGDELLFPRVRRIATEDEKVLHKITDKNEHPIHHHLKGKMRNEHQNKMENWEQVEIANLSYQELGHGFQHDNAKRILSRLKSAKIINLAHNNIKELSYIRFEKCEVLYVNTNWFKYFYHLPTVPHLKYLDLSDNAITSLDYLRYHFSGVPLEYLDLRRNPVVYSMFNYRYKVFKALPGLKVLDGVPKGPLDDVFVEEDYEYPDLNPCTIL